MFLVSKKYTSRFRANRASSYQKHVMNFPPYPVIRSTSTKSEASKNAIATLPERLFHLFS
jgi:hypothetical protein